MKAHRWVEQPEDAGKMTRKDICADCGAVRVRRWIPSGDGGRYHVAGYAVHVRAFVSKAMPMCRGKEGEDGDLRAE